MSTATIEVIDSICEYYGENTIGEVLENHMDELSDSVVPVFCTCCGEYLCEGEPDAADYECDNCELKSGVAVTELIFMGVIGYFV